MSTATAAHNGITIRPAWLRPSARGFVLGVAVALFILLCALPVIYMLCVSFIGADGGIAVEHYRRLLTEPRQRSLLLTSTLLGCGTATIATLIGAPLGLLLARAELPLKKLLRFLLIVPLALPPYITALAWIYLGGSAGSFTRWGAQLIGRDLLSDWTYSLAGAVIVLGISFYPLPMLATEAAARRMDGRLEEAALLVARPRRVLWRITLPLIAPAIVAAALIVFVLAVSEFGVPGLLRVRVFTTEVFTAFSALYDFGAATALATPLLVVVMLAGVAVRSVIGDQLLVTRRGSRIGLSLSLSRWRPAVLALVLLALAAFVAMPLAILCIEAGRMDRIVSAVGESRRAIANSLMFSTVAATLIVLLAVFLGYGQARAGAWTRRLSDLVLILIFAVPSTVVGVGLIGLWNRPGLAGEIYSSQAIVIIACLARFVPVAALMLAASVRQFPVSMEEAAEVAGAGWLRVFTRIVLPNVPTGVAAAWVVSFIFSFGELGATALVAPPGESTLPVKIYTIIANAPSSAAASLALAQAIIILLPLALLGVLLRGGGEARR